MIGCGIWGEDHLKAYSGRPAERVNEICDADPARVPPAAEPLMTADDGLRNTEAFRALHQSAASGQPGRL